VVIPDRTRRAPSAPFLRAVAASLAKQGVTGGGLDVVAATGTHRHGTPPEWREAIERDSGLPIRTHDAGAPHRRVGATSFGTEVALDPAYLDADLRLVLSAPLFHYFAGFGGGPKMVFPGLADWAGTLANHRRSLGPLPPGGLDARVMPGRTAGNPVYEDIAEAASCAPAHWTAHALAGAGGWRFVSEEMGARAALLDAGAVGAPRFADVVVASPGGTPRDVDVLQSHKALFHAASFARDGGSVVLCAETPGGVGSASLERWLGIEDREALERTARERYDGNAQTAISLRAIGSRVRVHWVGSRDPDTVRRAGARVYADAAAACQDAVSYARSTGAAERGAVLPAATAVIARS
jgi:nickel-dependent lactate racemase